MRFLSTSDLLPPDWTFLEPVNDDPSLEWETFSGMPRNALERRVPRPHIGRWRAARTAARRAALTENSVLVSHLPTMSAATNSMRRLYAPKARQIAFSFNFTDLPRGARLRYMKRALEGIEEFVVFSRFERQLYSEHLDIPLERLRFLPWAMSPPVAGPTSPADESTPYLCSIGGEGRDYRTLARVMTGLPDLRMVVVARPYSIEGIEFPPNMEVFCNLPFEQTWHIATESMGMVIPLQTDRTACGHITLIGAQQLGIPLVLTRSRGVEDYAVQGETAELVAAGDEDELRHAVKALIEDRSAALARASRARGRAQVTNALGSWLDYFREVAARGKIT